MQQAAFYIFVIKVFANIYNVYAIIVLMSDRLKLWITSSHLCSISDA